MKDWQTIGLAVAGWLATTWLTYRCGICSERRRSKEANDRARHDRKQGFLAFLKRTVADLQQRVGRWPDIFADQYAAWKIDVAERATLVCSDFSGTARTKFDDLIRAACRYNGANASDVHKQKLILADIQAIITDVEAA